jgi:Ser-tRNA(Ala) deacylase AlaX
MKELNRDLKIAPNLFRLETEHFTEEEADKAIEDFKSVISFMREPGKIKDVCYGVHSKGTYWVATILIEKYEHKSNGNKGVKGKTVQAMA